MEISTLKKQLKLTTVKLKRSESKLSMRMESFDLGSTSPRKNYDIQEEDEKDESGSSEDINSQEGSESPGKVNNAI